MRQEPTAIPADKQLFQQASNSASHMAAAPARWRFTRVAPDGIRIRQPSPNTLHPASARLTCALLSCS